MTNIKKPTVVEEPHDFDWNAIDNFTAKRNRIPNPEILEKYGEVIYNHSPYALDMYEMMFKGKKGKTFTNKEPNVDDARTIIDILHVGEREMSVVLDGMADCVINYRDDKSYIASLGCSVEDFKIWISSSEGKAIFLKAKPELVVEQVKPYVKGSISRGQTQKISKELAEQLGNPTSAYYGKIIEKNGGGFIINVSGIRGFLPGSLAATNIVRDFDAMIGKEIPVVVEDYLKDSNTFVFSYKKYVSMILPSKIEELDADKLYKGTVTGVAKFGVFVEFDDIFTGLLHTSKMTPDCRTKFNERGFKAGDKIDFWIKEISADNKIILTDEDPSIRRQEIEDFKTNYLGKIRGGEVVSVQPFGTLVKFQKDICGLISQKEIKTKKKNFAIGDNIMVSVDRVHNDKIFLSLPAES
jgi:predicted RNA-binding protein with RPS1 domain